MVRSTLLHQGKIAWTGGGNDVCIAIVPQELEGVLTAAAGATPDQYPFFSVVWLVSFRFWPGQFDAEVDDQRVPHADEIVWDSD